MRKGFTLVELLVVVAVVSLLAAMLLTAAACTRVEARKTTCMDNIKEVGNSLQIYANDHRGAWPSVPNDSSETLHLLYDDYLADLAFLACPATGRDAPFIDDNGTPADPTDDYLAGYTRVDLDGDGQHTSPGEQEQLDYVIDTNLNERQKMRMWRSTFAILCDAAGAPLNAPPPSVSRPYQPLWNHGSDGVNVLFAGGRAEWMPTVKAVDKAGNNILVVPNQRSEIGYYKPDVHAPEELYTDHNIYDHIGDGMSVFTPTELDPGWEWGDGGP